MKPPPTHIRRCPECEADNAASATRCWLCYRPLGEEADVLVAELVPEKKSRDSSTETVLTVLVVGTGILTILFLVGSIPRHAGLALLVALCAAPALLAVAMVTWGGRSGPQPSSAQSIVTVILGALASLLLGVVTVMVLVVLMIAAGVTAFLSACAQMLGGPP